MKKQISFLRSSELASVDYAYAGRIPAGMDLLFMAGACPLDADGTVPHVGDVRRQATLCAENLRVALKECGAGIEDVVYTRVLVASGVREDLVAAWRAIHDVFGEHDVPSTLSGVTVLGYPNQLVEIEAVAAVDPQR
jgi:enamine deaminase RidA (YjgF/YER057c/UK114 family)